MKNLEKMENEKIYIGHLNNTAKRVINVYRKKQLLGTLGLVIQQRLLLDMAKCIEIGLTSWQNTIKKGQQTLVQSFQWNCFMESSMVCLIESSQLPFSFLCQCCLSSCLAISSWKPWTFYAICHGPLTNDSYPTDSIFHVHTKAQFCLSNNWSAHETCLSLVGDDRSGCWPSHELVSWSFYHHHPVSLCLALLVLV